MQCLWQVNSVNFTFENLTSMQDLFTSDYTETDVPVTSWLVIAQSCSLTKCDSVVVIIIIIFCGKGWAGIGLYCNFVSACLALNQPSNGSTYNEGYICFTGYR